MRTFTRISLLCCLLMCLFSCSSGGGDSTGSISGSGGQILVSPTALELAPNESALFTAKVTGTANAAVTWTVAGGESNGKFTGSTGLYTAPSTPGIYTLIATLTADPSIAGTATVIVAQKPTPNVVITPTLAQIGMGQNQIFLANVLDNFGKPIPDQRVTWSVIGTNAGSFTGETSLYTAPRTTGAFTIVATSKSDPRAFTTAVVTVVNTTPGIAVTVNPNQVTMRPLESVTFEANVTGTSDHSVTWSVVGGSTNGTFTGTTGLYTAPSIPGVYTITATSTADPSRIGTATVVVDNSVNITVAISPKTPPPIVPGATISFSADVQGIANKAVNWTVVGGSPNGSFVGTTGLYVAPLVPGTFTVMATSAADPSKFDTTEVTVSTSSLPLQVAISPTSVSLTPGATFTFTATVSGSYNTTVVWSIDSGNGTVDKSLGIFRAPLQPGTSVVRATSVLNPTRYAVATVNVTQAKVVITPSGPQSMVAAESRMFTGTVLDLNDQPISDQRLDWQLVQPTVGTNFRTTSPFWYTAPATAGPVVLRATSVMDPTAYLDVPIAVQSYLLSVSPKYALVSLARYQQFTCDPPDVTWSVAANGAGGTISTLGLYLAPQPASSAGGLGTGMLAFALDYVVAKSNLDSRIVATVPVQVTPVLITPERASVAPGQSLQFSGLVMGTPNPTDVTWSAYFIPGPGQDPVASGGAINQTSGLFTAPATRGTYKVRATSNQSPVVYGEAQVDVQ